jgi:hypothetical protein
MEDTESEMLEKDSKLGSLCDCRSYMGIELEYYEEWIKDYGAVHLCSAKAYSGIPCLSPILNISPKANP